MDWCRQEALAQATHLLAEDSLMLSCSVPAAGENPVICPPDRVEMSAAALESHSLSCLLDVFSALTDPRKPKGRRQGLTPLIGLVVVALLAGKRNPFQIADFGKKRPALLKRLGFTPAKRPRRPDRKDVIVAPNRVTISRVLAKVNTGEYNLLFARWITRMLLPGGRAAIDGKALRGTEDYVVSVFVHDLRQVVWQEDVKTKENELAALKRALPTILDHLKKVRLFTGDAAFCQKKIAKAFVTAHRDYILQLKENQPSDLAIARDAFRQITAQRSAEAKTVEKRGASWSGDRDAGDLAADAGVRIRPRI
jgi:hypothetical protein